MAVRLENFIYVSRQVKAILQGDIEYLTGIYNFARILKAHKI